MAFVKVNEQLYIRPAPFVDVLVGVADYQQIPMLVAEYVDKLHLTLRAVLELVDLYIV